MRATGEGRDGPSKGGALRALSLSGAALPTALLTALLAAGLVAASSLVPPAPPGLATPPADSLQRLETLLRRAAERAEAGEHRAAAELYLSGLPLAPDLGPWLRLSALQQLARAGLAERAAALAAELEGDAAGAVPPDSVRLELARAAYRAGDDEAGLARALPLGGDADPALWTERTGPLLLALDRRVEARDGYRQAALADGAPADVARKAVGKAVELGVGWRTLERMARARADAGDLLLGLELLERALEAAPGGGAAGVALRLAEAELAAGRADAAHATAKRRLERPGLHPRLLAELELVLARSHRVRGERDEARVHLRRAVAAEGGEPSARAAYLLADELHDRGRRAEALDAYDRAARAFPGTEHGGLALMRAGLLALAEGEPAEAARRFRDYRRHLPDGSWASASLYWEGRGRLKAGQEEEGRALLHRTLERDPVGYYGFLAAERLGAEPLRLAASGASGSFGSSAASAASGGREATGRSMASAASGGRGATGRSVASAISGDPGEGAASWPAGPGRPGRPGHGPDAPGAASRHAGGGAHHPDGAARTALGPVDGPSRSPAAGPGSPSAHADGAPLDPLAARARALVERMDALRTLGWRGRAKLEYAAERRGWPAGHEAWLLLAGELNGSGWTAEGVGLGWLAFDRTGRWSEATLRAVYPLASRAELERLAAERGVPSALVAALIRQESAFDPTAVSPAGAVGLMQLMPATARSLARREGISLPAPGGEALIDGDLNLRLGTRYLAELLDRYDGDRLATLVSYNAGPSRWRSWSRRRDFAEDPELAVERIPFAETRRYVKAVTRNVRIYRHLYGLDDGAGGPGDQAEGPGDEAEGPGAAGD